MVENCVSTREDTILKTTTEQSTIPASTKDLLCYGESGKSEDNVTNEKMGKKGWQITWLFLKYSPTFKTPFLICSNWRHSFLLSNGIWKQFPLKQWSHWKQWSMQSFISPFSSLIIMWIMCIIAPRYFISFPTQCQQQQQNLLCSSSPSHCHTPCQLVLTDFTNYSTQYILGTFLGVP